jgi:hypothetical protein
MDGGNLAVELSLSVAYANYAKAYTAGECYHCRHFCEQND